jgi:hypothetical protein
VCVWMRGCVRGLRGLFFFGVRGGGETKNVRTLSLLIACSCWSQSGPPLELPHDVQPKQLLTLLNKLLKNDDESTPYTFFVDEHEVVKELSTVVDTAGLSTEGVLSIVYQPQAVFKVRVFARVTHTHTHTHSLSLSLSLPLPPLPSLSVCVCDTRRRLCR